MRGWKVFDTQKWVIKNCPKKISGTFFISIHMIRHISARVPEPVTPILTVEKRPEDQVSESGISILIFITKNPLQPWKMSKLKYLKNQFELFMIHFSFQFHSWSGQILELDTLVTFLHFFSSFCHKKSKDKMRSD